MRGLIGDWLVRVQRDAFRLQRAAVQCAVESTREGEAVCVVAVRLGVPRPGRPRRPAQKTTDTSAVREAMRLPERSQTS